MIGAFRSRQFLVFLLTGGIAAAVNFGSRILYNQWMGFSAAIVLAYITGMVTAFVLARLFVFRDSQRALHHSALYFVLVNGVAVLQTWAISLLLADWLLPALGVHQYVHELAHAAGVVVPVFTSYLGHKHLSFK
ncbi:MAG: GtrA family protein [Lautropia sp.]|nr:MAG: GtrA family protein [Lautropia sp.]